MNDGTAEAARTGQVSAGAPRRSVADRVGPAGRRRSAAHSRTAARGARGARRGEHRLLHPARTRTPLLSITVPCRRYIKVHCRIGPAGTGFSQVWGRFRASPRRAGVAMPGACPGVKAGSHDGTGLRRLDTWAGGWHPSGRPMGRRPNPTPTNPQTDVRRPTGPTRAAPAASPRRARRRRPLSLKVLLKMSNWARVLFLRGLQLERL